MVSCYFLFVTSPSELAPKEDIGFVIGMSTADPYATLDYVEKYTEEVNNIARSEEHTSELQSLMRISYAVFCLKKQNHNKHVVSRILLEITKRVEQCSGNRTYNPVDDI